MKFGGPQIARDKHIWEESRDLPGIERDDLLVLDRDTETKNYEGELTRLRRENVALRDQVQRSLKELNVYQVKYPSAYSSSYSSQDDMPPWTSSPEIMTPLFVAYDSRIKELEDIVEKQSDELDVFREKVETILAENEALREAQLEHLRQKRNMEEIGPIGTLNSELLAEMNERVDILMAENALLIEQKMKLSTAVDDLRQELSNRTNELAILVQRLNSTEESLNTTKGRLDQAERDREEAAGRAVGLSEELGNAKTNLDIMHEQLSVWQRKCSDAELALNEARKQLSLINTQAEDNNLLNMRRTKAAEERVRELHSQLSSKSQELEAALEIGRKLRREYQSTRQDAEGMLQVMTGLERQVTEYHDREEEVNRLARESQEKIEESLSKRDQALAREEQTSRELQRLQEERAQIALQRQSDLDAATDNLRQRMSAIRKTCEDEIKAMAIKSAELIDEAEKSQRDCRAATEKLEGYRRCHDEERQAVEASLKELVEKVAKVTVAFEEEKARRAQVQEYNKELRELIDKLRTQMESARLQTVQSQKNRDAEAAALKASLREAQRALAEKVRDGARKSKELEELRSTMDSHLTATERRYGDDAALYRKRSADADRVVRELELMRSEGDKQALLLVEEIKSHSSATQRLLESRLKEATDNVRGLATRNREIENSYQSAVEEKETLSKVLEEARACIMHLQEDCDEKRSVIVDLTSQLSTSYDHRLKKTIGNGTLRFNQENEEGKDYMDAFLLPTSSREGPNVMADLRSSRDETNFEESF